MAINLALLAHYRNLLFLYIIKSVSYCKLAIITISMLRLNANCPLHNSPYQYVIIAEKTRDYLRCKLCPFDPTCLRITSQVQYMKARMGQEKTKQREKSRSRSKSKGKQTKAEVEDEKELQIVQRVAEQQVLILQLVMKLLTEDQKKYQEHLQKQVGEHKKLWSQYQQSNLNIMVVNKLCNKNLLHLYIGALSAKGWQQFKLTLKSMYERSFICKRIIEESKQTIQQVKGSSKIGEESILKSLQSLVGKSKRSNVEQQVKKKGGKQKVQRSKSFAAIV